MPKAAESCILAYWEDFCSKYGGGYNNCGGDFRNVNETGRSYSVQLVQGKCHTRTNKSMYQSITDDRGFRGSGTK